MEPMEPKGIFVQDIQYIERVAAIRGEGCRITDGSRGTYVYWQAGYRIYEEGFRLCLECFLAIACYGA